MQVPEQLITKHFDIWSSTVKKKSSAGRGTSKKIELYGIKKLRELILELAVRGLLVPQDPNNEPASVLLKRIAKEKAQLVKDGKIKKQKPLPPISEGEKPFALPVGWEWVRLGEIGNIFNGNSINSNLKEQNYTNIIGRPFIATKDVGYGFQPLDYNNGIAIPEIDSKFRVAHKGAVLICAEGGSAGKKCGITEQDISFGNKLFANELYCGIEEKFVLSIYLSPSFFSRFSESMTGIIGGISSVKFGELIAPISPSKEQFRIVAKVDELMTLCDKLEKHQEDSISAHQTLVQNLLSALTNAGEEGEFEEGWKRIAENFDILFTTEDSIDQLKQSILQLAVMGKLVPQDPNDEPASVALKKIAKEKEKLVKEGKIKNPKPLPLIGEEEKPFELPVGWEWVRLGEIALHSLGKMLDQIKNKGTPRPYLRNLNVQWFRLDLSDLKEMRFEDHEIEKYSVCKGDVVICEGGYPGQAAIWQEDEVIMFQKALHRIRFVASSLKSELLVYYLRLSDQSGFLENYLTGSGIKHLTGASLHIVPLPLPPVLEQHRIVAKVDELMSLCDKLKAKIGTSQMSQLLIADNLAEQAIA